MSDTDPSIPPAPSVPQANALSESRRLFTSTCDFWMSAPSPTQFPVSHVPEIAFIGRSNVGKSSLINAVVQRKKMARTSNTPGRTQQVVFFDLGKKITLVDLPGYGFAQAPMAEKERWSHLVTNYLRQRPSLVCICLLVDSRHGLMSSDRDMMQLLDRAAVHYQIVLTKSDKVNPSEVLTKKNQIEQGLTPHLPAVKQVVVTSAEKNQGIDDLRMSLVSFIQA